MCSKYHGHMYYYQATMLPEAAVSHGDGSDGRHVCT